MLTRRNLALGSLGALLLPAAASGRVLRPEYVGGVRPRLIAGDPPHIDFGHGLVVPASLDVLHTLWEGDDRFLAFGRAASVSDVRASAQAELAAIGTMKLMLLTLAFAPDRLTRFNACGWRSASGSVQDLIQGDVSLPGRPYHPRLEEYGGTASAEDMASADNLLTALCVYMVEKREADVGFVRTHARLVCTRTETTPAPAAGSPEAAIAAHEICPAPAPA